MSSSVWRRFASNGRIFRYFGGCDVIDLIINALCDKQEIPIVVAGNKHDLTSSHREIALEDVSDWLYCELPRMRLDWIFVCLIFCNANVTMLNFLGPRCSSALPKTTST